MKEETKKKKDHVRFEDTVTMSIEDFQNGNVKDWNNVKNLRIEQDFQLSKPSDYLNNSNVSNVNEEEADESIGSQRKIHTKGEFQKIQFKKMIDDLDLWQSDLKQKKRDEVQSTMIFVKESIENTLHKNNLGTYLSSINNSSSVSKKNLIPSTQNEPEIDVDIINSILEGNSSKENSQKPKKVSQFNPDNEETNEEINSGEQINSRNESNQQQPNGQQSSLTSFGASLHMNNQPVGGNQSGNYQLTYPKSLSQIPLRPVTLTSLKIKKAEDMKVKTVSRYVVDIDNKVVIKTDAQLQAEQNNLIINQIFKNKLSRVVEAAKPESKSEYQDIVQTQTALFKKNTLSHFKSLHYLAQPADQASIVTNVRDPQHPKYGTIEYKKLYSELFEDRLLQRNCHLQEEQRQLVTQAKYLDDKERNMLIQYSRQSENSKLLKESLNKLRIQLSEKAQKIKSFEIEMKARTEEFDRQIYKLEQETMQASIKLMENKKRHRGVQLFSSPSTNPYQDQMDHARKCKAEAVQEVQKEITQLVREQRDIQNEVEHTIKEYESAKEQKKELRYMLKFHYLSGLKQQTFDKNCKSLVWTIIKLFAIKEEITYNIFPDCLDEKNIQFLLQYARLESERQERRSRLKVLQLKAAQGKQASSSGSKQDRFFKKSNLSSHDGGSQYSSTQSLGSSTFQYSHLNSSIKKPVFYAALSPKRTTNPLTFELQQYQKDEKGNSQVSIASGGKDFDKQMAIIIQEEENLRKLEEQIDALKEKEIERIIFNKLKENQDSKQIFYYLFGYYEGEKNLLELERRKLKQNLSLESNKTFHFASSVNAQQAAHSRKNSSLQLQLQQGQVKSDNDSKNNIENSSKFNKKGDKNNSKVLNLSLPESALEPLKRNQDLLGIHRQTGSLSQLSSPNLANNSIINNNIDAFSYFSSCSIKRNILEQRKSNMLSEKSSQSIPFFQQNQKTVTFQTNLSQPQSSRLDKQQYKDLMGKSMDNQNQKKQHLSILTGRRSTESFTEITDSSQKNNNNNNSPNVIQSPNLGNHRQINSRTAFPSKRQSIIGSLPLSPSIAAIVEGKIPSQFFQDNKSYSSIKLQEVEL